METTETVEAFLKAAELEHLLPNFEKQKIKFKHLKALKAGEFLQQLIPSVGEQLEFLEAVSNLENSKVDEKNEPEPVVLFNGNLPIVSLETVNDLCEVPLTSSSSSTSDPAISCGTEVAQSSSNLAVAPALPASSDTTVVSTCLLEKLKDILKKDDEGRSVISCYELNGSLDNNFRSILVNKIIGEEINKTSNYRISHSVLKAYSLAIQQLFPNEKASVYYIPYDSLPNGEKFSAKGKLLEKYQNRRCKLRKVGLISPLKKKRARLENTVVVDKEDIDWLSKCRNEPWTFIREVWTRSFNSRQSTLKNIKSAQDYFNLFPVLTTPKDKEKDGFDLIREDFERLYPGISGNFFLKWPTISEKIIEFSLAKAEKDVKWRKTVQTDGIILDDLTDPDIKKIRALQLLPFLLAPAKTLQKKLANSKEESWSPSRTETLQGFICELKSLGDLESVINIRREKLDSLKIPFQPMTVFVQDSKSNFINIDATKIQFDTALEAFDATFKAYFSLNLAYPIESQAPFTFVEKYVYKMPSKGRKAFSSVEALASNLKI